MMYEVESTETKQQVIFIVLIFLLKIDSNGRMKEWGEKKEYLYEYTTLVCAK